MTDVIDAEFETKAMTRTSGDVFLPAMSMPQAVQRYNSVLQFTQEIMKPGKDFGVIPGVDKPSLLKPGAEKLCSFFGLTPKPVIVEKEEDWNGTNHNGEPFFYYHYRVQLWKGDYLLGEGEGSCNSMESKYRYRWVQEDQVPPDLDKSRLKRRGGKMSEFAFAIDKAETGGQYGKPAEYWQKFKDAIDNRTAMSIKKKTRQGKEMDAWEIDSTLFRVPNPDIADQVNAIQKMAYKRALVAVVLIVCNASEYYTQDLEDLEPVETHHHEAPKQQPSGNGKPPSDEASMLSWFTSEMEAVVDRFRRGDTFSTPSLKLATAMQRLEYLRDGAAKKSFSDENAKTLAFAWFKAAMCVSTTSDQLQSLDQQVEAQGFDEDQQSELAFLFNEEMDRIDMPVTAADGAKDIPF